MSFEKSVDPHLSTPVTVTRLAGAVTVIDQQGDARELHVGDQVQPGEHISVSPNSGVLLLLPDGNMLPVGNMPAVQDFTDPAEISLEDFPVQAPLTAGEGEALIAKAESRNITDSSNDEKINNDDQDDRPVSSSITQETDIAMDLSQVTPELSGHSFNPAASGYNSDADSQTYGSLAADNSTQAHPNTGSAGVSLQPVFVNFVPVVTGDIAGNVHEDIHLISTGSLNISDRNTGDQDTVTLNNGNGACGTLAIDQQGHWAYQLDNTNPIVQALGAGEHLTEHFTISVTDSHGAVVDKQITITVDGTNDLPVISGVHAGTLVEGATQEASGQLTQTDVDTTDTHSWSVDNSHTAQHGIFTVDQDGQWHYKLDNTDPAVNTLAHGQQLTETIVVKLTDNHGGETTQQVTVTINGSNAAPVIGGVFSGSVIEDKVTSISEKLTVTDTDATDTHTFSVTNPQGGYGHLSIDPDTGLWTYNLNHAKTDSLAAGEHHTEVFTVSVTDNFGGVSNHQVSIEVAGSNDKPVIGNVTATSINEGGATLSGQLTSSDIDHGDTATYSTTSTQAGFNLNPDGSYTVDPTDKAFNHLAVGEHQTLTIPVTVTDNNGGTSTTNVEVTITGTNDNPVIGSVTATTVAEGSAAFSGQLTSTDIDHGDTATYSTTATQAGFNLNPDGSYTVDPTDAAFDRLAVGQQLVLTIPVTVTDNNGGTSTTNVEVTITGTNDNPVIGGVTATTVAEGSAAFTGQLTSSDVDTTDTATYSTTSKQAGFSLKADGSYTVDPTDAAFDHLAVGEHQTLTIPVTVTDNNGGTSTTNIDVTITGTNDNPVVSSAIVLPAGTEDTNVVLTEATLLAHATDVDTNDQGHLSVHNVSADHGNVAVNPDGTFTFTPDANYNGTVHFTYDVQDPHGASTQATATMNLAAVGDAAVIGGVDTGSVTEATAGADMSPDYAQPGVATLNRAPLYADGKLTISDPDAGEAVFDTKGVGYSYHGQYGDLILQDNGVWHYKADAGHLAVSGGRPTSRGTAIDELGEGQSLTDTITVYAKDGTAHDIVITIHGSNDRPYCASEVVLQSGTEDQAMTLTTQQLLANTHDVDANDVGKLNIQNLKADHGSIHVNGDGTFTFMPDKDYNGQVHFTYDVADAHGGLTHTDATASLQAVNDAAVITDTQTDLNQRGVTEDKGYIDTHDMLNYHGHLNIADPDAGEAKFDVNKGPQTYAGIGYDTQLGGHVVLQPDGDYIYTISNTKLNIQALGDGEKLVDHVTVRSADGTTQTIALTVHGTNDAPEVTGAVTLSQGSEDTDYTLHTADLLAHAADTDTSDKGHLSVHNLQALKPDGTSAGTVTDNGDGTFIFHPAANYNGQVNFTYDVQDPHGASVTTSASMSLAAVADAATFSGDDSSGLIEDKDLTRGKLIATGHLNVMDADAGENNFGHSGSQSSVDQFGGSLRIDQHGTWYYSVSNSAVQDLSEGQKVQVTHTVHSADGTAHDIVITITGTNDTPTVSSTVTLAAGTEDTAVTINASDLLANATDVDTSDKGHLSVHNLQALKPDGTLAGTITDNADGTYTFHPAINYNGAVQFTYDIQDSHGASVQTTADLNLQAVSDAAVITATGQTLKEDTNIVSSIFLHAEGHFQVHDPDGATESKFATNSGGHDITYKGSLGGDLQVYENGNYFYDITNVRVDYLKDGEQVVDRFQVRSEDGTVKEVVFTIQGTSDAPRITSSQLLGSTNEDGAIVRGTVHATDPDTGDQGSLKFSTTASVPGFNLKADGSYSFDPHQAEYQHLEHSTWHPSKIDIPITVTDRDGLETTQHLHINLYGTNDAPDVTGSVDLGAGTEDTSVTIHPADLLAHASDKDDYDRLEVTGLQVDHGQVVKNQDGTYTFTPEPDYNGLVNFTYQVTDSQGASVSASAHLNLAATNDAATLSAGLSVTEDATAATLNSGWQNLDVQDIDGAAEQKVTQVEINGVVHTLPANFADNIAGTYGTFNFTHGSDGHDKWSYTANNQSGDIQGLKDGQSLHDNIVFITKDGTRIPTTVDIHGKEDGVVIDTAAATTAPLGTVVEDTQTRVEGQLLAHDADKDDSVSWQAQTIKDAHGTFTVDASGHWTYTLDPIGSQSLSATDHFAKGFDVTAVSSDGSTATRHVEVIFQGTDDKTRFGGANSGQAHEDGNDVHQFGTQYLHDATDWQKFEVNDKDSSVDHLMVECGGKTVNWDMQSSLDIQTPYGQFQLVHADGTGFLPAGLYWNYIGDNSNPAVQGLKAGETLPPEAMTLVAPDGTRFPITVTVNGAEDGVKIDTHQGHVGDVDETGSIAASTSGQLLAHDLDTHDSISWHATPQGGLQGSYGTLVVKADGSWTYTVDPAKAAALAAGELKAEHFNVTAESTDGSSQSLKISIDVHGTNQGPTVSGSVHLPDGAEDISVVLTAAQLTANAQDVDHNFNQALRVQNLTADHGQIAQNTDGTFTFTPDKDYNGDVQFTYDVTDGHGGSVAQTASMNLAAVADNPNPTVDISDTADNVLNVNEAAAAAITGKVEPGSSVTSVVISDGTNQVTVNHVSVDAQGNFNLSNVDLSTLSDGNLTVTANAVSQDGTTGISTDTIVKDTAAQVQDNGTSMDEYQPEIHGNLIVDDEHGVKVTAGLGEQHGSYGKFVIHADGSYTYTPDSRIEALAVNEHHQEHFTFTVTDRAGNTATETFTIDLRGTNDAPVVSASVSLSPGTEDTAVTLTAAQLLAHASDIDGDNLSVHNLQADHGHITDNHDGTFTFTPDKDYNGKVTFGYDVQDAHGASVKTHAAMELASVADTPILSVDIADTADNVLNASEVTSASITGKLDPSVASTLDSIDISDGTTSSSIDASRVSVAADGSYSVSGLDLSAFKDGMLTITAHATSHDGTTATSTDTIVKDTSANASIVLDPITGDNIINTAESQQQNIAVTGSVTGDYKDGDRVTVSVGSQQYQAAVDGQGHFSVDVPESEFEVAASSGTGVRAEITVTDDAGNTNTVSAVSPVVMNLIPQPATLTGESGVHSTVYHATLTAQGAAGQWGIQDHTGHSTTTMAGQYGMLSVNAQTGELTYDARTYSGVQKSGTPDTGTHTEHFVITLGGQQNAQVEVLVELSGQSIHGHSGHFVQKVEVLDMNSAPADEPDQGTDQTDSVTVFADDAADVHDIASSSDDPQGGQPSSVEHHDAATQGADAEDDDMLSLVRTEEPPLDFDGIAAHLSANPTENVSVQQDSTPLNMGDVLDSTQAGEADILQAVDKLDPSKPDAVDKPDNTDKADSDGTPGQAAETPVDDAQDVMPDRAAMESQLVETPDEHQT